jgi:hypothetical protein
VEEYAKRLRNIGVEIFALGTALSWEHPYNAFSLCVPGDSVMADVQSTPFLRLICKMFFTM